MKVLWIEDSQIRIKMLKQKVKWTWTWKKGKCEKGASIKKEIKSCAHIHIICKQKKWNA